MQSLAPTPASAHNTPVTFTHPMLSSCTHVFVLHGGIKRPLQMPYDGPYKVLQRSAKHFTLLINNKPSTISVDRLKPCFYAESEEPSNGSTPLLSSVSPVANVCIPSGEDISKSVPTTSAETTNSASTSSEDTTNSALSNPLPTTTIRSGRRVRLNTKHSNSSYLQYCGGVVVVVHKLF